MMCDKLPEHSPVLKRAICEIKEIASLSAPLFKASRRGSHKTIFFPGSMMMDAICCWFKQGLLNNAQNEG
jgi:murein tripeptide amidase MpaA